MNYDHDYLGVGNSQHPANQPEIYSEEEKDLTIGEALETGHDHLLYEAIGRNESLMASIESELIFIRDYSTQKGDTYLKNRITKFLKTFG